MDNNDDTNNHHNNNDTVTSKIIPIYIYIEIMLAPCLSRTCIDRRGGALFGLPWPESPFIFGNLSPAFFLISFLDAGLLAPLALAPVFLEAVLIFLEAVLIFLEAVFSSLLSAILFFEFLGWREQIYSYGLSPISALIAYTCFLTFTKLTSDATTYKH